MGVTAIDLFAGAGGMSEGAALAGVDVVWAANHWPLAVQFHQANHPGTLHSCQDLQQADWSTVPSHDIVMAAPACQGHTPARGKEKPHHDKLRNTAWAVVDCVAYHKSEAVLVENVPAMTKWELYPSWVDAMQRLGYAVAPHIVDAADHGVPQNRKRLLIVCTRSKAPLVLQFDKQPHKPINDVIEWDRHTWNLIETPDRVHRTLARVRAGRQRFGDRFLAPYYSSGSGKTGRSVHRPIGTIPTKDRWAVIDGDYTRFIQVSEARKAFGYRPDYILPPSHSEAIMMLGNSVPPPMARDFMSALKRHV